MAQPPTDPLLSPRQNRVRFCSAGFQNAALARFGTPRPCVGVLFLHLEISGILISGNEMLIFGRPPSQLEFRKKKEKKEKKGLG